MENKKWLLPLGIGVVIVNFVLTVVLIGATIPTVTKMNKIVSSLDKEEQTAGNNNNNSAKEIPIEQQETILYDTQETVTIKSEKGEVHVVRYSIGISIDSKNKKYKDLSATLDSKKVLIQNIVREVVEKKSFEEISKVDGKNKLEDEVKKILAEKLDTNAIVSVILSGFIYS